MESLTHTFMPGASGALEGITLGPEGLHDVKLTVDEAMHSMSPQDPRRGGSNPNRTPQDVPSRIAHFDLSNEVFVD